MTLVAIGGHEDKTGDKTVWKRVLSEAKGVQSRVVIITTATADPVGRRSEYGALMQDLGVSESSIHHVSTRAAAQSAALIDEIAKADIVFFSGGDQLKITSILSGTPLMEKIISRYETGDFVVSGSSAGAAAASSLMITGGEPVMQRDAVSATAGLSFLPCSVIDTHFSERGRLPRLFNLVSTSPRLLGIGLDEDTAIIYKKDDSIEVVGKGSVIFVNGRNMTETTVTDTKSGEVFTSKGLEAETLRAGDVYSISQRKKRAP